MLPAYAAAAGLEALMSPSQPVPAPCPPRSGRPSRRRPRSSPDVGTPALQERVDAAAALTTPEMVIPGFRRRERRSVAVDRAAFPSPLQLGGASGMACQGLDIPVTIPGPPPPGPNRGLCLGTIVVYVHRHWEAPNPRQKAEVSEQATDAALPC